MRLAVHLEEHLLRHVFRFTGVAQDVGRDAVHEASVLPEERSKRVAVRRVQVGHQLRIGAAPAASAGRRVDALAHDGVPHGVNIYRCLYDKYYLR